MHATVPSASPLSLASRQEVGVLSLAQVAIGASEPVFAVEIEEVTCNPILAIIGPSTWVLVRVSRVAVLIEGVSLEVDSVVYGA